MRKLIFVLFIFLPHISWGQRTLTSNETWSGIHTEVTDVVVPSPYILTIDPGTTVQFASGKSLKISVGGAIHAGSLAGSAVTFTASNGVSWGHVFCLNSASSYFRNCIFEKGNAVGLDANYGPDYGGGLYAKTTLLTIDGCTFRNNHSVYGGGVFIGVSSSPSMNKCIFYGNTVTQGGGGLYIWQSSNSVVTNCIIYNNSCTGSTYGGGGVFLGWSTGTAKLINCVIANNTSALYGNGIYFLNSPSCLVLNSIVWGGSGNPLYFDSTPTTVVQYSGIQGGSYTNCVNLSSTNTAPDGPNFVATDGSNWSLKVTSACLDKGTSTYSGAPIPQYDFNGNSRVFNIDQGPYELQYSRWSTSPSDIYTWNDPLNWVQGLYPGSPLSTGDVLIPPLPSSSVAPNVGFVTVNSGTTLLIQPGGMATISSLTNNGSVILMENSTNVSSLITDTHTGNNVTSQIYLSGGGTKTTYKWHYISSPFNSLAVSTFAPTYTLDLAQYVESRPASSTREGWVAYDGYIYSTDAMGGPTFNNLSPGKGYDFWRSADMIFSLSGKLNTGDVTANLGFSGDSLLHGFNLLGNPFSSGLNWDDIVGGIYNPYPANTSLAIYYTRDNVQCSYVNGVGTPADVTGIIPPMQGFFIKTYAAGNSIVLPANSRVLDNVHARYKGAKIISLIRLQLNESSLTDETVIRFDSSAKAGLDNNYDAIRFGRDPEMPGIYTRSDNKDLVINGQPYPGGLNPGVIEMPLTLNLVSDTGHYLKVSRIQGLDKYDVTLKDLQAGTSVDLKTNPVIPVNSLKGLVSGRFVIVISVTVGIDDVKASERLFNLYQTDDYINIVALSEFWNGKTGSVRIIDLAGRTVSETANLEFSSESPVMVPAPPVTGIYLVEIRSGLMKYTGKIILK